MNWLYSVGAVLLSLGFACTAAQAAAVTFDPEDEQGVTLAAGDVIRARGFQFKQLNDNPALLFAGATAGAYASNGSNSGVCFEYIEVFIDNHEWIYQSINGGHPVSFKLFNKMS